MACIKEIIYLLKTLVKMITLIRVIIMARVKINSGNVPMQFIQSIIVSLLAVN